MPRISRQVKLQLHYLRECGYTFQSHAEDIFSISTGPHDCMVVLSADNLFDAIWEATLLVWLTTALPCEKRVASLT